MYTYRLTIGTSDEYAVGLGGSGDNSQVGGFMFLSSEAVTAMERRCFTGIGGGSSLIYIHIRQQIL